MKLRKKLKAFKKCPRCGNKCLRQQETCEDCGLVFARLEYASNKAAKKKIAHFDKDFVIYTNQYPKDMSWWKLLLLVSLTGLFGGHYYYVGKYWKGALMSAGFVYLVFCTIFNAPLVEALETYGAYLPIGIYGISWMASLVYVACKKFKVPVIVEVPEQIVIEKREEFFSDIEKTALAKDEKKAEKNKTAEVKIETGENKKKQGRKKKVDGDNDSKPDENSSEEVKK